MAKADAGDTGRPHPLFIKYYRFLPNGLRFIFPWLKAKLACPGTYCILSSAGLALPS